jgi:hypothetical protein
MEEERKSWILDPMNRLLAIRGRGNKMGKINRGKEKESGRGSDPGTETLSD